MNLVGYVRVSTAEQADHGISLEDQKRRVHAYAESRGDHVLHIFEDRGVSGSVPWNQRLLDGAFRMAHDERHAATRCGIVAVSLDRLSRSIRDTLNLFDACQHAGIDVLTIKESMDTSSPTGRFTLSILAAMHQFTRESIQEKVRDALDHLKKTGKRCGNVPYGFTEGPAGYLHPQPEEHVVLMRLEDLVATHPKGYGARLALRDLASSHPVNPRTGKAWTLGTVANLIKRARKEARR